MVSNLKIVCWCLFVVLAVILMLTQHAVTTIEWNSDSFTESNTQAADTWSAEGVVDCTIAPCQTWAEHQNVLDAYAYEQKHHPHDVWPIPNRYRRCQPSSASRTGHPFQYDTSCTGTTEYYRHRHRFRQQWFVDAFEFDGSAGQYDDVGSTRSTFHGEESMHKKNDTISAFRRWRWNPSIDEWCTPQMRVLVTAEIKKGYGLTNRLLSLAGILALAGRTDRVAAIDTSKKTRIPIHKVLNLTRSIFPQTLRLVLYCNYTAPVVMPKILAPHSLQTIDRKQVALRPHKVIRLFDDHFSKLHHQKLLHMHDMYLRYPFEQEGDSRYLPGPLLCGFHFANWLHEMAMDVIRRIRRLGGGGRPETVMKYAAWHLRLETSDAVAMRKGRLATTVNHVLSFLNTSIAPLLRERKIRVLTICSGPLPNSLIDGVRRAAEKMNIVITQKSEHIPPGSPELNDFGTRDKVREREGDQWITPTATDAAAVDALILEHADIAIMSTTSSLTALVYAKRCGGGLPFPSWSSENRPPPITAKSTHSLQDRIVQARQGGCSYIGNVFVYDTYRDGSYTHVVEFPCGYQMGAYIVGPPGVIPRPPPELDVFGFRFVPESPLFTEPWRNRLPGEATPVPPEQP